MRILQYLQLILNEIIPNGTTKQVAPMLAPSLYPQPTKKEFIQNEEFEHSNPPFRMNSFQFMTVWNEFSQNEEFEHSNPPFGIKSFQTKCRYLLHLGVLIIQNGPLRDGLDHSKPSRKFIQNEEFEHSNPPFGIKSFQTKCRYLLYLGGLIIQNGPLRDGLDHSI